MECPVCHRSHSRSGKEFTEESLKQHQHDAHTLSKRERDLEDLRDLSDEFSDLPDGAFWAIAMERGVL